MSGENPAKMGIADAPKLGKAYWPESIGSVREHFFLLYETKSENREISGLGLGVGLGLPC